MTRSNMSWLHAILAVATVLWTSFAVAETATIASDTPLRNSSKLLSSKVIQTLSAGTAVKVFETKGSMSRVESVDDPGVKGWVLAQSITRNKDVAAAIAKAKSTSAPSDTKTTIASSMGGVAKGFSGDSVQTGASGKGGLSGSIGAVAKGKIQGATDEAVEEADEMAADAEAAAGKFKGKSAATLEKIESTKVTEEEIANFMKEGGLRSRLIR
jgi:hypothetical protein